MFKFLIILRLSDAQIHGYDTWGFIEVQTGDVVYFVPVRSISQTGPEKYLAGSCEDGILE